MSDTSKTGNGTPVEVDLWLRPDGDDRHPARWAGVRSDRTLDYTVIETFVAIPQFMIRPKIIGFDGIEVDGKKWIEFVVDDGLTNLMVRIPEEDIKAMHDSLNAAQETTNDN